MSIANKTPGGTAIPEPGKASQIQNNTESTYCQIPVDEFIEKITKANDIAVNMYDNYGVLDLCCGGGKRIQMRCEQFFDFINATGLGYRSERRYEHPYIWHTAIINGYEFFCLEDDPK